MAKRGDDCQLPSLPYLATGFDRSCGQFGWHSFKRFFAFPWNYFVKKWLKRLYYRAGASSAPTTLDGDASPQPALKAGDWVRVRSLAEIKASLDPFHELKGCAFLPEMAQYCGTEHRVLKAMHRFLDERDYKVKRVSSVVLLDDVICQGTPVFGPCDRCCFLFWREEWLEKIDEPPGGDVI